jgi:hemoglobin
MADQSAVVRMHAGNGEHQEMDERAVACFAQALDDAGLPAEPRLRRTLQDYFSWATSDLATYHQSADDVPDRLTVPRWGWDGLVSDQGR